MEEATLLYDVNPELLANFLDESEESVETLNSLFVELEQRPKDREIIESIFRVAHSIKGLAAFLSLRSIKDLTHELETVLDCIRQGRLNVEATIIDCLLAGFDELTRMLAEQDVLKAIVVAEGVAPYSGASTTFTQANQAVRVLEVNYTLAQSTVGSPCETYGGQEGFGPSGEGYNSCAPLDATNLAGGLGQAFGGPDAGSFASSGTE